MRGCCVRDWNETLEFLRCWICQSGEFGFCRELLSFSHTVLYLYGSMICQEETGKGGSEGSLIFSKRGNLIGKVHCIAL